MAKTDVIAAERIYFDANGKAVPAGPNAVRLLAAAGMSIPADVAAQAGIDQNGHPQTKAQPKSTNKARPKGEDKGAN